MERDTWSCEYADFNSPPVCFFFRGKSMTNHDFLGRECRKRSKSLNTPYSTCFFHVLLPLHRRMKPFFGSQRLILAMVSISASYLAWTRRWFQTHIWTCCNGFLGGCFQRLFWILFPILGEMISNFEELFRRRGSIHHLNWSLLKLLLWMEEIRLTGWGEGSLSHYLQGFSTIPGGCLGFLNHQQYPQKYQKTKKTPSTMGTYVSPPILRVYFTHILTA